MKLNFLKYQGTGNDFVMVDAWNDVMVLSNDQVGFLCDRRVCNPCFAGTDAVGVRLVRRGCGNSINLGIASELEKAL